MSWYKITTVQRPRNKLPTYRIEIRRWHPGLWCEVYTALRLSGTGVFASLFYTVRFLVKI